MAERGLILRMQTTGTGTAVVELGHVGTALEGVDRQARRAHGSTGLLGKAFGGLRSMIRNVTGIVGLGGVSLGMGEMIKNAQAFQSQTVQLHASLVANVTRPTKEMQDQMIEFADKFAAKGGFAPPQEIQALTQLLRVTHSTKRSMQDLTLATNIARGSHKDLAVAARAVQMVEGGRLTMLTRLGIVLPKGTTAQEAYAILLKRYAGATEAYNKTASGAMTNFTHAIDILGEKIGLMLAPALTDAFNWLTNVVGEAEAGKGIFHTLGGLVGTLGAAWRVLDGWLAGGYRFIANWVQMFKEGNPYVRALSIAVPVVAAGFVAWTVAQWGLNAALAVFDLLTSPITLLVVALVAIVAGLILAYEKVGWFHDAVGSVFSFIKDTAKAMPGYLHRVWDGFVRGLDQGLNHMIDVLNFVAGITNTVIQGINEISPFPDIPLIHGGKDFAHVDTERGYGRGKGGTAPVSWQQAQAQRDAITGGAPGTPTTREGIGGKSAAADAVGHAVKRALHGTKVHMNGRVVGQVLTDQGNQQRARQ